MFTLYFFLRFEGKLSLEEIRIFGQANKILGEIHLHISKDLGHLNYQLFFSCHLSPTLFLLDIIQMSFSSSKARNFSYLILTQRFHYIS
jgi:hypothetical protein